MLLNLLILHNCYYESFRSELNKGGKIKRNEKLYKNIRAIRKL